MDGIWIDDHCNYLMTTNSDYPVRVETSDRRFVILRVLLEAKMPPSLFKQLHRMIVRDDGGALAAVHFYKYLMARDLSKFDSETQRPVTLAVKEMMAQNIPPWLPSFNSVLKGGALIWGSTRLIGKRTLK